jgi:hypothetical protein
MFSQKARSQGIVRWSITLIIIAVLISLVTLSGAQAQTSSLKVQYRAADNTPGDNQIKPHFNIVNTGASSVALSGLKIRYWYTWEGAAQTQLFSCDWAIVGCANVTGVFVKLATPVSGADYYEEVGFTAAAGSIAAGGQSGEVQTRFSKSDYTNYNETGDYSFDPTKTVFADWTHVTLYNNGVLVWGVEPGGSAATSTATSVVATLTRTATAGPSLTPTRTITAGGPTATRTRTSTTGPSATRTSTAVASPGTPTLTPPPTLTRTPTAGPTATTGPTSTPGADHISVATWFSGIGGAAYGGCGIAQADVDTQDFVALNVQNTPNDYSTFYSRPIAAQYAAGIGLFDNGRNCGRWVHVTISDYCDGVNDGATNQPFCRGGLGFIPDAYNGAELDMIVADSCQDGNAWCRDDPYHLDLTRYSLNKFVKNGVAVGDMDPDHWNNRHIQWHFEAAPNYSGDITIGFIKDSQAWWTPIAIKHLKNGIHGIDYFDGTNWVKAVMDSDMGQTYVIGALTPGGSTYQIRVYDVTDQLINNGRIYNFSYPTSCGSLCVPAFTQVTYTVQ